MSLTFNLRRVIIVTHRDKKNKVKGQLVQKDRVETTNGRSDTTDGDDAIALPLPLAWSLTTTSC